MIKEILASAALSSLAATSSACNNDNQSDRAYKEALGADLPVVVKMLGSDYCFNASGEYLVEEGSRVFMGTIDGKNGFFYNVTIKDNAVYFMREGGTFVVPIKDNEVFGLSTNLDKGATAVGHVVILGEKAIITPAEPCSD